MAEEVVDAYAEHVKALRERRRVEAALEVKPTLSEDEALLLCDLVDATIKQFKPNVQAVLTRARAELMSTLTTAREGWKAE